MGTYILVFRPFPEREKLLNWEYPMISLALLDKRLTVNDQKEKPSRMEREGSLPDEDSNLDKQNQNLSYYLYTIGQSTFKEVAKIRFFKMFQ